MHMHLKVHLGFLFSHSRKFSDSNLSLAEKIASRRRAPGGCGARQPNPARENELHYANKGKSGQLEPVPPEIAQQIQSTAGAPQSYSRKSGTFPATTSPF